MKKTECNILTDHLLDFILSEYLRTKKGKLYYQNDLVNDVAQYLNSIFKIIDDVYIEEINSPVLVIEYVTMGGDGKSQLKKNVTHILNFVDL